MTLFDRPILFYSNYCKHSTRFLTLLKQYNDVYDTFVRINIDVKNNKRPDIFYKIQNVLKVRIEEVPTIILVNSGKPEYILAGLEAFNWIEKISSSKNEDQIAYNPNEMGLFSDMYSSLKNDKPREQLFQLLGKEYERINTPKDEGVLTEDSYTKKLLEREEFENSLNKSNNGNSLPPQISQKQENYNKHKEEKRNNLDYKYQQLLDERRN